MTERKFTTQPKDEQLDEYEEADEPAVDDDVAEAINETVDGDES